MLVFLGFRWVCLSIVIMVVVGVGVRCIID